MKKEEKQVPAALLIELADALEDKAINAKERSYNQHSNLKSFHRGREVAYDTSAEYVRELVRKHAT